MSTRTKGFFEQDHGRKSRPPQWPRKQQSTPLNTIDPNVATPKPPIPATSQSKSKLKAFEFVANQRKTQGDMDETENDGTSDTLSDEAAQRQDVRFDGADVTKESASDSATHDYQPGKPPQLAHASTFPSTPAVRIPLEELIGSFDESIKRMQRPEDSPEERIGWIPNSSSTLLTPNRKRKRARSSSPPCLTTSSQRQEASAFFAGSAAQVAKETSEADPATVLWRHYATSKEQHDDGENLFDELVFNGSPKALETPAKGAGFRRWASAGNDWPTSKTNKRRTASKASISLWQAAQLAQSGCPSKVSAMVDKIQESLATQKLASSVTRPTVRVNAPSSSSPLPAAETTTALSKTATSPLHGKRRQDMPRPERLKPSEALGCGHVSNAHPLSGVESDDARPTEPVVDSLRPTKLHLQSKAPLPAYKRPSITRAPSNDSSKIVLAAPCVPSPTVRSVAVELDEFGEGFDLSAEDLDMLMTGQPPLCERPLHQIPPHPSPPPHQTLDMRQQQQPYIASPAIRQAKQPIVMHDFDEDDDFACDDIDEASLAQAEFSATQAFRISPRKRSPRKTRSPGKHPRNPTVVHAAEQSLASIARTPFRYVVKQVVDGEYTDVKGRRCQEKVAMTEDEKTHHLTAVSLRDSWINTSLSSDDIIHIPQSHARMASSNPPGQVVLSDSEDSPLLVVHPDHMLSATTVADSFDCIRKAVLQDRIKATGETSKAMIYGKILHEIFQQALSANRWDDTYLADSVRQTVQNHVEGLWELGMVDTVLAIEEIKLKMGELAAWASHFVVGSPLDSSLVDDEHGEKILLSISKLIAIEEHIWSPNFGLKGNIDATVQTTLRDQPKGPNKQLLGPFEVKTGKTTRSPAHVAQTALYTLLLSDRYDFNVKAGILYYLESSATMRITPRTIEMRQMMQQRNRLATYIHRARHPARDEQRQQNAPQTQEIEVSGLPSMLRNPNKCGRCYAQASCFAYHALVEDGSSGSAGMVDDSKKNYSTTWNEAVGHLQLMAQDQTQARVLREWFTKWDRLLTFEESDISRFRKELWTMTSAEREAVGRCFGNMILAEDLTSSSATLTSTGLDGVEGSGARINRYAYSFMRSSKAKKSALSEGSQLTVGEPIVVSSESGQWALANGYVIATGSRNITVAVDRRLGNARLRKAEFNEECNHALHGIMTVGYDGTADSGVSEPMLYRLDKDEFSNGLALIRNNLVTLMSSHPNHTKLRNQVVCNSVPRFVPQSAPPAIRASQLANMNEDQRAAISKVLSAQDYALILGMPGTGKTTTIAQLIGALLAEGQSILLTSYTHTAVDTILLKIRDIAPPNSILRLGVPAKINTEVQTFCRLAAFPQSTISDVQATYMDCQIVAATCLGVNHSLFKRRAFDVCIVDEASQITLPTSLGPLLHARKFVLVGDHYQLPPLVQDKSALEGGLDVSLFRQLSEAYPDAVAPLGRQYRMCEEIMSLSNALIYDGQLRCGNDAVARRALDIKDTDALALFHSASQTCATPSRHGVCWLRQLCRADRKVVFANTDGAGKAATETLTSGMNITNQYEATLTAHLVLSLLAVGVPARDIGVITLYRSQLALLRQLFKRANVSSEVEVDSADRFQGRDKECVILSMVRSNEAGVVGDLLRDWRRVNVALTRAKSKLVVLGSRKTLRNNDLLDKFLLLVAKRQWILDLPPDADNCHNFNFSPQTSSSLATPPPSKARKATGASPHQPRIFSPTKRSGVLRPSASSGNRSPIKKKPLKVISGRVSRKVATKFKEATAVQIFEEIVGEG